MLRRANRFHGHNSLRYVYKTGQTVRSDLFGIKYGLNQRRADMRCAVVVSKKVSKSAVKRNRMRRRLYELIRTTVLPDQPMDIVLTVFHESTATIPMGQLQEQFRALLKKTNIAVKVENKTRDTI